MRAGMELFFVLRTALSVIARGDISKGVWSSGSDTACLWTFRGAEEIARERQVGLDSDIVYGKPPICIAISVLTVKICKYQWMQKLPRNACGNVSFLVICFASVKSTLFLFKSEAEVFVKIPHCEQCIQYLWVILLGPRARSPRAKNVFCHDCAFPLLRVPLPFA